MFSFFIVCAVFGGGVLLLQLVLALFGLAGHDLDHSGFDHAGVGHDGTVRAGLNLFSIRSVAAGLAFFGLTGMAVLHLIDAWWLALPAGLVVGVLAMGLVAWAVRSLLRLERDATLRIRDAIGSGGTVYIPIPGAEGGPGKVTFALQDRTVELDAVTRGEALPTGTAVTIVDVRDGELLEVVPTNPTPTKEM